MDKMNLTPQTDGDLQEAYLILKVELVMLHAQYKRLKDLSEEMGADFSEPVDDLMDSIDDHMSRFSEAIHEIVGEQDRRDA